MPTTLDPDELLPEAPLSIREYKMRRMVAQCATFEKYTGEAAFADRIQRVFIREWDSLFDEKGTFQTPEGTKTPLAVIDTDSWGFADPQNPRCWGHVNLVLVLEIPAEWLDPVSNQTLPIRGHRINRHRYCTNFFGGVVRNLADMSGADQTYDTDVTGSELDVQIERYASNINPREEQSVHGMFAWEVYTISDGREGR